MVWLVVHLRYLVIAGWVAAAAAAYLNLPSLTAAEGGPLDVLAPSGSAALAVERQSLSDFGNVLTADTELVQRDPHGLSLAAQQKAVQLAYRIDTGKQKVPGVVAVVPVLNTLGIFPSSRESSTTIVTYLYFSSRLNLPQRYAAAHAFAHRFLSAPDDHFVGVTGPGPARWEQGLIIDDSLLKVEVATLLLIAAIVTVAFRGIGASLVTLFTAGTAYEISIRVLGWLAFRQHASVPVEVEPLLVVLLLAIVTDYSIFFLSGVRGQLRAGAQRVQAVRITGLRFTPTVLFAGLIVAASSASLLAARVTFLRVLGPDLAIAVLVGVLAAVTLVPALLATFGRLVFWPSLGGSTGTALSSEQREMRAARSVRGRITALITHRVTALPVALGLIVGLVLAAQLARGTALGSDLLSGLPPDTEAARAAAAAAQGFSPGILGPSVVLVQAPAVASNVTGLARLEAMIGKEPGVAGVIGPREQFPGLPKGLFVNSRGDAARYVVTLDHDPYGAQAIADMRQLQARLPALVRQAGLQGARAEVGGGSALAADSIDATYGDIWRVGIVMAVVDLLLLALFLRSLLAPLYLLAASMLAVGAPIGLAAYLFEHVLHVPDISYFVPIAAGVLLVALGSDYNVFVVGRIAEEVRDRPRREALQVAVPIATRAISAAGFTLASSFALLALVPTLPFREFAFIMVAGVLIDAFVVRSYLVPALVALLGRLRRWEPKGQALTRRRPAL